MERPWAVQVDLLLFRHRLRSGPLPGTMATSEWLLRCGLALAAWVVVTQSQQVNTNDVKYLACSVCKNAAAVLFIEAREMRAAGGAVSEEQFTDLTGEVCDMSRPAGRWIRTVDYAPGENGKTLELQMHDTRGRCGAECVTIGRACTKVMEAADMEIAEVLFAGPSDENEFIRKMCMELTSSCPPRKAKSDLSKRGGEPFVPLTQAELDRELMEEFQRDMGVGALGPDDMGMGDDYAFDDYGYDDYGQGEDASLEDAPFPRTHTPLDTVEEWITGAASSVYNWGKGLLGKGDESGKQEL